MAQYPAFAADKGGATLMGAMLALRPRPNCVAVVVHRRVPPGSPVRDDDRAAAMRSPSDQGDAPFAHLASRRDGALVIDAHRKHPTRAKRSATSASVTPGLLRPRKRHDASWRCAPPPTASGIRQECASAGDVSRAAGGKQLGNLPDWGIECRADGTGVWSRRRSKSWIGRDRRNLPQFAAARLRNPEGTRTPPRPRCAVAVDDLPLGRFVDASRSSRPRAAAAAGGAGSRPSVRVSACR